jgi:hypothetical protein
MKKMDKVDEPDKNDTVLVKLKILMDSIKPELGSKHYRYLVIFKVR